MTDYLTRLNDRMLDASKGENSLTHLSVRIQMAQADLATRDYDAVIGASAGGTDTDGGEPAGAVSHNLGRAGGQ